MRSILRFGRWPLPRVIAAVGLLAASAILVRAEESRPAVSWSDGANAWSVHLRMSAEEYAAMQPRGQRGFPGFGQPPQPAESPRDPDRESHRNTFGMELPWAMGSVAVAGKTFDNVGIRYKGNGTLLDASRTIKKSFRIDLDRFDGEERFLGSKTINLHCGVADPSKYRETLGYALYRAAGVPAPRTAFAEVRISVPGKHDDELLGLYTVVEAVDKPFLKAQFGTDKGLLMKPEGVRELEDRGDDWERYKAQYEPKRDATPEEAKRVIAFARLVQKSNDETFRREIESYLDLDAYLRFLAATSFVSNVDSFFVLGHNYYLYLHPTTKRFHFLPWDLDRAFANHPLLGSNEQKMDLSLMHPYGGTHRLTERVLAVPGVGDRYQVLLKELSTTAFVKSSLLKELDTAEKSMKELLARDAKAAGSRRDGPPPMNFGRPPDLRTFVEKRTESVAAQLAGTSKGYSPTTGFGVGPFGGGPFGPGRGGPGQPGAPGNMRPPKVGDMMGPPLLGALDTGKDGKLSREEWLAAAKKVFAACAKNDDGRANARSVAAGLNELFPRPPEGGPQPPFQLGDFMAGPIVARADANKDGGITSEELMRAAETLFDESDRKKTGELDGATFAELLTALFPVPRFGPPQPEPQKDKE